MSISIDYMQLCRLCLVRKKVNVPIFGEQNDVRQIYEKISSCLPVKVSQEDNLPKNICENCTYKVDLLYEFRNTAINAEKQLIQWVETQIPQSHAHPHSILEPETIILKEERLEPEINISEQNVVSLQDDTFNYHMPYQLQTVPQTNPISVAAPVTSVPSVTSSILAQHLQQPLAKRGRPPKKPKLILPAVQPPTQTLILTAISTPTIAPLPLPPTTALPPAAPKGRPQRKAAAKSQLSLSPSKINNAYKDDDDANAASVSSEDSENANHNDEDNFTDEDFEPTVTKKEIDSEEEENVNNSNSLHPTAFVEVDSNQPGPSGLNNSVNAATAASVNTKTEPGREEQPKSSPGYKVVGYIPLNTPLDPFRCETCGERFSEQSKLQNHKRQHMPREACPICQKLFHKHHVKKHMDAVHSKTQVFYKCDICTKKLKTKQSLKMHERHHYHDYRAKCELCNKDFVSIGDLNSHKQKVHEGKRFICFPCNKVYNCKSYFKIHQQLHDPNFKTMQLSCPKCGKTFNDKYYCAKHIKSHNKDKFVCDICGKTVTSAASLQDHKRIHAGIKPFTCDTCGKSFTNKRNLAVHKVVHTKEKPHQCKYCGKCFTQLSPLKIHQRYHTGERPYVCHICDMKFVAKSILSIHSKKHGLPLKQISKS